MSANNYLTIQKSTTLKNSYDVFEKDADTGRGNAIFEHLTKEEAIKKAQEYMKENVVEYGIKKIE